MDGEEGEEDKDSLHSLPSHQEEEDGGSSSEDGGGEEEDDEVEEANVVLIQSRTRKTSLSFSS